MRGRLSPRVKISALLTTPMPNMATVLDSIRKAGLRDNIRVIIGGSPVSEEFANRIGADAARHDAADGLEKVKKWLQAASRRSS